ncbi:hypothetical protein BJD99_05685 [Rhodococcus sp. 1163]|nr:hypothetical protein BJD99_05685 [Rhodococcus sp. 1163]
MVDDDGEVLVAAFVRDLVDPDSCQACYRVDTGGGVGPHPSDDRSHCAPGDPHQLGDCLLGALCGQPGDLLIERARMPGTMTSPRGLAHRRPVDAAINPRSISLQEDLNGSHIQAAPLPSTLPTVIPGGPRTASSTSTPGRTCRPCMRHDRLCVVVEFDVLDVLDAQHSAP